MTIRTVTVKLRAEVAGYLARTKQAERSTKDLREEVDRLNKTSHALTKAGLISSVAGLPGLLAPAGAAMAALPGLAFTAGGAFGALALAVNGTGDAMKAVGEGDAAKLREALAGLSVEARRFIAEYERVKPTLDRIGDATQDAFFREFNGSLEQLTRVYLPAMLVKLPKVSAAAGKAGRELAGWASSPTVVAKVNRQLDSAAELTGEWTRLLRAGLDIILDLADAGRDFNKGFVGGMADGTEGLRRWIANARATGQLTHIFENAQRVLSKLAEITAKVGDLLADIMDNPALVDGALTLLDVLGMTLDVVSALLTVFESLPPGVQETVVTLAVLGGTALLVAGRIVALKAALDSMQNSAVGAGSAIKGVGAWLAGPWGVALTMAIALLGVFASKQKEAKAAADGLRGTLDEQTGAITAATRQQVVNNLAQSKAIEWAKGLGLNLEDMTDAVLGGEKAINVYNQRLAVMAQSSSDTRYSDLITPLADVARQVDMAKTGFDDMRTAMGKTGDEMDLVTDKTKAQVAELKKLADALQAQSDPVFALIKAQKDLRDAQKDYNQAVKENGRTSEEAREASLALAEASVRLTAATAATAGTFDGKLTPAMYAALRSAGATEQQIRDVEKSFLDAAKAGERFAGDYGINVRSAGLDVAISKARTLKSLLGSFAAAANAGNPGGYVSGRRWGGITEHARWGTLRQAQMYSSVSSGARYAFAEPETGGELFVPRRGDPQRSLGLLDQGARWYGHRLAPAGGGNGGGTQTIVQRVEHVHRIELTSKEMVSGVRRKIELSGGSAQNYLGSFRQ